MNIFNDTLSLETIYYVTRKLVVCFKKVVSKIAQKEHKYKVAVAFDLLCIITILMYGSQGVSSIISPLAKDSLLSRIFNVNSANASHIGSMTLPTGKTVSLPDLQTVSTDNMQYKPYIVKMSSDYMRLDPDSLERRKKEVALMAYLTKQHASAADMLLALQSSSSIAARAWGMEYIWLLRQKGELTKYHMKPLEQERIEWAKERNIDPRILAIAADLYGPSLQMLSAKPELFFEAAQQSKAKDADLYKYVPSPAVIAKLQMMETGWSFMGIQSDLEEIEVTWPFPYSPEDRAFVNIGSVTAWDALNLSPEWFPSGHDDLIWIAQKLEKSSGLPYVRNVKQLPGSFRGSGDGSGGAIGPQFMPLNARLFMTWYDKANVQLNNEYPEVNPFNPLSGTILTYLYISSEFYHRQLNINNVITDVVRPGYSILDSTTAASAYHPKLDPRIRALLKWNPLYWEAKNAVQAGDEYSRLWIHDEMALIDSINL